MQTNLSRRTILLLRRIWSDFCFLFWWWWRLFLACEDLGRMFDHSFPACAFLLPTWQSTPHQRASLLRPLRHSFFLFIRNSTPHFTLFLYYLFVISGGRLSAISWYYLSSLSPLHTLLPPPPLPLLVPFNLFLCFSCPL